MAYPNLFAGGRIGSLELRNRVVMAPIDSVIRTEDGGSNREHAAYLGARAAGGVGLIVCDNMIIDWPQGSVGAKSLRLDQDRFIPSIAEAVEEVHFWGGAIVAQINHAGRQTTLGGSQGLELLSPSAIAWDGSGTVPRSLTKDEIHGIVEKFVLAAKRVRQAQFDGVQIHASHGYLLASFLSPALNQRSDEYGGSTANRARIVLRVIERIREELGRDYPLLVRINARDGIPGGVEPAEAAEYAALFEQAGVDAIDVSAGTYETPALTFPPMMYPEGHLMDAVRTVKQAVSIPVIGVGKLQTPELCDRYIADGYTDFVALGRALLTDPEWPIKAEGDREDEIRPCIACNVGCIHRIDQDLSMRCNVNPYLGRELLIPRRKADVSLELAVVGAGVAGLEFAIRAHDLGHRVHLYEAESEIGGQLVFARVPTFKRRLGTLVEFYERELGRRDIELDLNARVSPDMVSELAPDALIVATGGQPAHRFAGADGAVLPTYKDVLHGDFVPQRSVVVVGGGPNGCELAVHLAENGHEVSVVEIADSFAQAEDPSVRQWLSEAFAEHAIAGYAGTTVETIDGRVVRGTDAAGSVVEIPYESVVLATGVVSDRALFDGAAHRIPTYLIGDCYEVATILQATERATRLAERIGVVDRSFQVRTSRPKEANYVV